MAKEDRDLAARSVIVMVSSSGVVALESGECTPTRVGLKAFGLSALPIDWVPRFIVVEAGCVEKASDSALDGWIEDALARMDLSKRPRLMVRSSGTAESLQQSGLLESQDCMRDRVVPVLRQLAASTSGTCVHWIVQDYKEPRQQGHLSNERRFSREQRDWAVEYDPVDHMPGRTEAIAVRRWRDGDEPTESELLCPSQFGVTLHLKRVSMWATRLARRAHLEWLWDGQRIWVVQILSVEDPAGDDPEDVLARPVRQIEVSALSLFREADDDDYANYPKLRNVRLYRELGYQMPAFYVLDKKGVMEEVLQGTVSDKLLGDLRTLCRRPLMLRTDGSTIAEDKRDMLPRSGELHSECRAHQWLAESFRGAILGSALEKAGLCLLAHHFLPAAASAWAKAVPGDTVVRIESLWGVPEGLDLYSHDTFEVDTLRVDTSTRIRDGDLGYAVATRLRYKGTYVTPDASGEFVPRNTDAKHDWSRSIRRTRWIEEIARFTRLVAEREAAPVKVMWFVDVHPEACASDVLPWYHEESRFETLPSVAPRVKNRLVEDFVLTSESDLQLLEGRLAQDRRVERVVVRPEDRGLIRNREAALLLGSLAEKHGFVVELAGGVLSHMYYLLSREGARVECVDLFGADEDVLELDKLVRDRIPDVIERRGERVRTVQLAGEALKRALLEKLVEEAYEALDATSAAELLSELADISEVVTALCEQLGTRRQELEAERREKNERRGRFAKGLMLVRTLNPGSIRRESATSSSDDTKLDATSSPIVIDEIDRLPRKPLYRRPDLRRVESSIEKLFTFETELNQVAEVRERLNFVLPDERGPDTDLVLTVDLARKGVTLRVTIRLRRRAEQLRLDILPNGEGEA